MHAILVFSKCVDIALREAGASLGDQYSISPCPKQQHVYHSFSIIFVFITRTYTITVTFDYLPAIIGHRSFWLHAEPPAMSHDVTQNLSTAQAPVTWCQQRHSKALARSSTSSHGRRSIPQPAYSMHHPQIRDLDDMTGWWRPSTADRARQSQRCSITAAHLIQQY